MNMVKTTLLMGLLTVLLVSIGGALGGRNGVTMAFLLAAGMNFFSYWFSDKIVLSMYGARQIEEIRADPAFPASAMSAPSA